MDCEKCGGRGTYEWADKTQLIGGFNARLCTKCLNLWHEYVTAHPLWAETRALGDRAADMSLAAEVTKQMPEGLTALRDRAHAIHDELYHVGKAWVVQRSEAAPTVDAVDPHLQSEGTLTTREKKN